MNKIDFSGGGIAAPMLVLLAGYVAGLEQAVGKGGTIKIGDGEFPAPPVTPKPDAIGGAIWLDTVTDYQWSQQEAMGGFQVTLKGPIQNGAGPTTTATTNSQGVYEFTGLAAGAYELTVPSPTAVQSAQRSLVLGSASTHITHVPQQWHPQFFAYR